MRDLQMITHQIELKKSVESIAREHEQIQKSLDYNQLDHLIELINSSNSIFLMGMGRSGLMMKAAAMRLMHLGFQAFVVGETTTPAIGPGDLLIAGSGSGTTKSIVRAAETSQEVGARIASFTTDPFSALGTLSDLVIEIQAAQKQDHRETKSIQYAGSLFEQSLLMIFDSVIQVLWKNGEKSAEELWKKHSNLE